MSLFVGDQRAPVSISLEYIALHILGKPLGRSGLPAQQCPEPVVGCPALRGDGRVGHIRGEPPHMRQADRRQPRGGCAPQELVSNPTLDGTLDRAELAARREKRRTVCGQGSTFATASCGGERTCWFPDQRCQRIRDLQAELLRELRPMLARILAGNPAPLPRGPVDGHQMDALIARNRAGRLITAYPQSLDQYPLGRFRLPL